MSLATPTSLSITRLRAVAVTGNLISGGTEIVASAKDVRDEWVRPRIVYVYGFATWGNTETDDHQVELSSGCNEFCHVSSWNTKRILPKGSTQAAVLLAKFDSTVGLFSQSAAVSVKLFNQSGLTSGEATADLSVGIVSQAAFTGSMSVAFGSSLVIPAWSGTLGMPQVEIWENFGAPGAKKLYTLEATSPTLELPPLSPLRPYQAILTGGGPFLRKQEAPIGSVVPSYYTVSSLQSQTLEFLGPESSSFTVTGKTVRAIKDQSVRILLESSHPATFTILSGAPQGFSISQSVLPDGRTAYYLSGTPLTAGSFTISIQGTRLTDSVTATGTISLAVVESGNVERVQIVLNPGWLNNGLAYKVGDEILLQLASVPWGAKWRATGLPPGTTINESTGLVAGTASAAGRFLASFIAEPSDPASSLLESAPATITFTVTSSTGTNTTSDPATRRIPWVVSKWNLADLQILARTRQVQSTLFSTKPLPLKTGDNINFAVFFVGSDNKPFAMAPDRLRVTIRPADNLEGALVFESEESPAAITTEPDPYYLLAAATTGRQRQIVQEWVEDRGKNEPLPCVADVDWTKDGQHFSSASFPVSLELDVTRP